MVKKQWFLFTLGSAISGISNSGLYTDDYSFNIDPYIDSGFPSKEKCEAFAISVLEEYKTRGVGKDTRFIALEVICNEEDEIFVKRDPARRDLAQ